MIIEMRPGPLTNKGGELMLRAALDELAPQHQIVVEHWVADYAVRARLGLYQKVWFKRLGPLAGLPGRIVPRRVQRIYGLVTEGDVEAIVDASGFAYGDQWGVAKTAAMARSARRWRGQGKRLILLPQSFGPFRLPGIADAVRRLIGDADLVFARDAVSLGHLDELGIVTNGVQLAPDITIAMGDEPAAEPLEIGTAYVVPNEKMLTHAREEERKAYVQFLLESVRHLRGRGVATAVLVHESAADRGLAAHLQHAAGGAIPVIHEQDALLLRARIADAYLVIGSRYHALVSALSNGVPVLASGWSHKYESLLRDFGCERYDVGPTIDSSALHGLIDELTDPQTRSALRSRILRHRAGLIGQINEMWSLVHATLGRG